MYSDEKKTVLDTSFLAPLSYECVSCVLMTCRESFEIQMMRCYMRLLPDSPFLLFYRDQNVNYWLFQSFDADGSFTTTIIDKEELIPIPQMNKRIASTFHSTSCQFDYRSVCMLSPSLHALHVMLQNTHQESFIAAYFHASHLKQLEDDGMSPPSQSSCDLLLRYVPQSASTLLLEADRLGEELESIQHNAQNPSEWREVKTDVEALTVSCRDDA